LTLSGSFSTIIDEGDTYVNTSSGDLLIASLLLITECNLGKLEAVKTSGYSAVESS
jgi:hypothetical protein